MTQNLPLQAGVLAMYLVLKQTFLKQCMQELMTTISTETLLFQETMGTQGPHRREGNSSGHDCSDKVKWVDN